MMNIQHLLSHISTIRQKNDELIEATGGRFNMFRILGVNHYENTHSAILAEFLNRRGTHGLNHLFLDAFLKVILPDNSTFEFKSDNSITRTEVSVSQGRLDILVEDEKGRAIIIENKIYADDQFEQLKRYNEYAIERYGKNNYLICYLTLFGSNASNHSGEGIEYIPVSYDSHVIRWLESCVNISSRFPLVRETINQYINSLKQLTNQSMDTLNNKEIVELAIKSTDNLKSAMALISNEGKIKEAIIEKLLEDLAKIAENYDMGFKGESDLWNLYKGFSFKVPGWKHCRIGFQFQQNKMRDMIYGICYKNADHKNAISTEVCNRIAKGFNGKSSEYWPIYRGLSWNTNWNNSTYVDILEGKYQSYVEEKMLEVLKTAEGLDL